MDFMDSIDSEAVFETIMMDLVSDYARSSGIFISGELLKRLKDSFVYENQSFVELRNIIGMSIANFGMKKWDNELLPRDELLPDFEKYWFVLETFWRFLKPTRTRDDSKSSALLHMHMEVQTDNECFYNAFNGYVFGFEIFRFEIQAHYSS